MKYSASSIKTWFLCQRLWGLTYTDKREPIDSGSFEINYGRAFHGLLESDETELEHFGDKWTGVIRVHHDCYGKYWENKELTYKMLEHEVPFDFELIPGVKLHGYLDGIAELNGEHYIVETKTTGSDIREGARYWEYKSQDIQVGVYLLAAKHCEELQRYNIQGVIYDVTRRPTIKQKRTESITGYINRCADWYYDNRADVFQRVIMTRTDEQLDDLVGDILIATEQQKTSMGFAKNRDACYKFSKQCGFYGTCFEGESVHDDTLYQVRKRR
jgi:hypothetical protein